MRKKKPALGEKSARADQLGPHKKPAVSGPSIAIESVQSSPSGNSVADAARQRMISEAAYYRAQKRGFGPGRELDDRLAAEVEIAGYFLHQEPAAAELH